MLFHSNCWVFLSFYLRRRQLVLMGSLNLALGARLANKKGDANRNIPEALKRTLVWCTIPLKDLRFYLCALNFFASFVCVEPSQLQSIRPGAPTCATFEGSWEQALLCCSPCFSHRCPVCFPNHNSFQLWPWALICPRSAYCFNVNVETCARALFFFF